MMPSKEEWLNALSERHGKELQMSISGAKVAICGLGGLGSNIAILLARAGIGKLILIDFDSVDITNLNRQQYKISQIGTYKTEALMSNIFEVSPYTDIQIYTEKITEENIGELLLSADIICEAFDSAEDKAMLTNYVLEKFPTKYLVAASGMAGIGRSNSIITRRVSKRFYLCGDAISGVSDDLGLISSRVAICASHQAHVVLRILANKFDV